MLFFNSAENVLKLQASFNTFCLGKLEGSQLTCEIHSGVLGLRWTWMLYRSGCRPASRSIYCGRNSGLQSRQAWLAQEETAQPGTRRDYPHTHSLFFTLYYSLSLWAEAKMSGQGKRGEKKERGNYLEVNNRNTMLHSCRPPQLTTGFKKDEEKFWRILFFPDAQNTFNLPVRDRAAH